VFDLDSVLDAIERLPCLEPEQTPEIFGPTDINAQSSDGRLAVGIDRAGTLTVVRYPSLLLRPDRAPRHRPRRAVHGAAPNAGAFLGPWIHEDGRTRWLRDCRVEQRYARRFTDAVLTECHAPHRGLRAVIRDVVTPETDVLVREVAVDRPPDGPDVSLVAFENPNPNPNPNPNLNLVVSREPRTPVQDWTGVTRDPTPTPPATPPRSTP